MPVCICTQVYYIYSYVCAKMSQTPVFMEQSHRPQIPCILASNPTPRGVCVCVCVCGVCVCVCVSGCVFVCLGVGVMGVSIYSGSSKSGASKHRDVRGQHLCQNIKVGSEVAGLNTVVVSFSWREGPWQSLQKNGFVLCICRQLTIYVSWRLSVSTKDVTA